MEGEIRNLDDDDAGLVLVLHLQVVGQFRCRGPAVMLKNQALGPGGSRLIRSQSNLFAQSI